MIANRKRDQIILVDNLIYSFAADLDQGIYIKSYIHGRDDYELEYLANVLEKLDPGSNVAKFIEDNFRQKPFFKMLG